MEFRKTLSLARTCTPHLNIYTFIRLHIYTSTYTYIYTFIHLHIHTSAHSYICTFIHLHIHTSTHTYICTFIHLHIHIHTSIHAHAHTYINIYTFIRLHIQTHQLSLYFTQYISSKCSHHTVYRSLTLAFLYFPKHFHLFLSLFPCLS